MKLERSSGLLLHPTSLPGPNGIGEIGEMAYHWINFLERSGQTVWQILPLGPTGYGNSPYQTTSVYAGNPLLIDLDRLVREGLLPENAYLQKPDLPQHRVDFDALIDWKLRLLLEAHRHFEQLDDETEKQAFADFCALHDPLWLDDFALFMAIKNAQGGKAWSEWPEKYRLRRQKGLAEAAEKLKAEVKAHKFLQYLFFKHWQELKSYANERGISIMGDIPIYVTFDSADVWSNQDLFLLDKKGNPKMVAGVPPDYFSATGQLWGNPIYDWPLMKKNGFSWWIERVRLTMQTVDLVRIDHFRGFESYWAVPFGEETAVNGEWVVGPGGDLFDAIFAELGDVNIVAEDLGLITPEVEALRDRYEFPGMKILQFAFGGDPADAFLPHNFNHNCVVYTGSHDNDTTIGWYATAPQHEKEFCARYLSHFPEDISWELIRLASASVADVSIFPLQDVLGLGNDARMNLPGNPSGNWNWRVTTEQLKEEHVLRLRALTEVYGRLPKSE